MAAKLGPWQSANLRGTATIFSGDGSEDDVPKEVRFAHRVGRMIVKRLRGAADSMRTDAMAIFLLAPDNVPATAGRREPSLGDGIVEVAGYIWFVAPTAQSGRPVTPPSTDDATMFEHVEELGFGTAPAAVFNPQLEQPSLRYYPEGVSSERFIDLDIRANEVTPQRVRAILDYMADKIFITPDTQIEHGSSLWANAGACWAATNSEAIIQAHMKTALTIALVDCNIRHEQPTLAGRVDIEIEQQSLTDPNAWRRPLEIEIKVLRERGATGRPKGDLFNQRWIRRGIRQAAAYRDERNAEAGMLCCFDMRANDRRDQYCSDSNLAHAAALSVEMYRKFLYSSSEAYRQAEYEP